MKLSIIRLKYFITLSFLSLFATTLHAQSNARSKFFLSTADTITIDSLSIIPKSENVFVFYQNEHIELSENEYYIDYSSAQLFFYMHDENIDSIQIQYQVFPLLFTQKYFHKDPNLLKNADIRFEPFEIETKKSTPYLEVNGLDYNGSLTRGISFGNGQDVVVNSTFNLQMSGVLQNEIKIAASISESNIPIQPEGNTQQLQEFDKIFIELSKDAHKLIAGDFEIESKSDYFLRFYKKSQGLFYDGTFTKNLPFQYQTKLSLASAKGIYTEQEIFVSEGNQGPYKLKGVNNESFIIILAGSERVFIDGKLLLRGSENDYTIDYNSSEITFTTNLLLTKDQRIKIEFEYTDKNYFRTAAYWENTITTEKSKTIFHFSVYSEQDNKNQPVDQTIDSTSRSILENVGDSIQDAFLFSLDTIAFDAGRIMYAMIDSLGYDSVFVYNTNPDSAQYVLVFTELGLNKGNYIQQISTANGRIYKWVVPIDGVLQGSAEPVILLATPKKKQMISGGFTHTFNSNNSFIADMAYSNVDQNTFSKIGNGDNGGIGIHTNYSNKKIFENQIELASNFQYEFAGKNFNAIERYRSAEFLRDWNIISSEKSNEHLSALNFNFIALKNLQINLNSSAFVRDKLYEGAKQSATINFQTKTWSFYLFSSYLWSKSDSTQSNFLRPEIELKKYYPKIKGWNTALKYAGEKNKFFMARDSILFNSIDFDAFTFTIQNSDSSINDFQIQANYRYDQAPDSGKFVALSEGKSIVIDHAFNRNINSMLSYKISYRELEIKDTSLTQLINENTLLARLQYRFIVKKGLVTSDIFYEIGTGQEPKKEYTFVEVEPGLGLYTWNDYNENSIPELDEFEIAVFADEGNYIQIYIPTDTYIKTNATNFNYSIQLNPKAIWFDSKGLKKAAAKFAFLSSLQLNQKLFDDGTLANYNFIKPVSDSLLVSSNTFWQNAVFFNRTSTIFNADYALQINKNKSQIINGPEERIKREHRLHARYKIYTPLNLEITFVQGEKEMISIAFSDKNYQIPYFKTEPKVNFIKQNIFRSSLSYQYQKSANTFDFEKLTSQQITAELRYQVVSKSTISSKFSFVQIKFEGDADSPVGYVMLEGLQNGNNLLWNVNFDRRISQVLQLNISYDGRKTGTAEIIHVGRLQMRALF